MNALKHRLTLEMTVLNSQAIIHIKKNDTQNKLIISLTENNKPYVITEDVHAAFVGKKPDGKIVFNDCDIVGNTIEYTITAQTSVVVGAVNCELRLYDNNNNLLTAPRFTLLVDEIIYDGDKIQIESENEINTLASLIVEVNAILEAQNRGELNGATFTPSMDDQGVLSWTNDKGLENPTSYNFHWDIINNAGWSRIFNGTPNLIGDNRWYKIEEYLDNLQIGVRVITTEGEEKQYSISPEWAAGNRVAFRFKECTIKNNKEIHVKIDVYIDMGFFYGYRIQELTILTDDTIEKIYGVYFVSQMLWRNGPADGKDGADGENGATFTPSMNDQGVLSWTNDKGLENPEQYNLQKALIEIAGWSKYPSNKIEDKRWYRAQGEVELTIWVNALTTDGKPLAWDGQLILHPDSRGYSTFKLEDMEKGTASVDVGILQSTTSSIHFEYSSVVVSFVDALLAYGADAKLGEITSVYILVESNGQTLYRNGPADGTAVDLSAYLTTSKFNDYINGLYTTPHIVTNLLTVLGRAVFEHAVVVQEPVENNNPATKKYVDDSFANIKLAEDGEY